MSNLTITVDDDVLTRARIRALQQGTSVNALLRQYLEAFAGDDSRAARRRFADRARQSKARSGKKRWTRDELHER